MQTVLRDACISDFSYIDSLRKKNGYALGFIPKGAYMSILTGVPVDGRRRWTYSDILVTEDNGDLTGFCYVSYSGSLANVFQIVVQEDARRWYRASLMLGEVEQGAYRRGKHGITCRVAQDLESNFFWVGMGYEPVKVVTSTWLNQRESKSKRALVVYVKRFLPLFDWTGE